MRTSRWCLTYSYSEIGKFLSIETNASHDLGVFVVLFFFLILINFLKRIKKKVIFIFYDFCLT